MNIKGFIMSIIKAKGEKEKRNRLPVVDSPIISDEDDGVEDIFWIEIKRAIPSLEEKIGTQLKPQVGSALISCKNNGFNHYEIFWVHENSKTHCASFRPNPVYESKVIVIERLWVCSCLRRRGIGRAIISCIEEAGRHAGYDFLYVVPDGYDVTEHEDIELLNAFSEINKDNKEVGQQDRIAFYKMCGFEELENAGNYVKMWKLIVR